MLPTGSGLNDDKRLVIEARIVMPELLASHSLPPPPPPPHFSTRPEKSAFGEPI